MSEHGFNLEGLLRSLQANLMGLAGFLIFIFIVYLALGLLIRKSGLESDEKRGFNRYRRWGLLALVALAVLAAALTGANRTVSNRLPRSDIDKSAVYEQMESHRSDPTQ